MLAALTACRADGPLFPALEQPELVVMPGVGGSIFTVLDVRTGKPVRALAPTGDDIRHIVMAPDGRTMYAWGRRGAGAGTRDDLLAMDVSSARVLWRLPMQRNLMPTVTNGIGLLTGQYLGVSADGATVHVGYAQQGDVLGLAAVDVATQRPIASSGPWRLSGPLESMPGSAMFPDGALLVPGYRQPATEAPAPDAPAHVFLLHPRTLAVLDSIGGDVFEPGLRIFRMMSTPDPRTFYLFDGRSVRRFDLETRTVTASMTSLPTGAATYVPQTRYLVFGDAGDWNNFPGSGLLHLYTDDLRPLGTIDVSTPLGGTPHSLYALLTGGLVPSGDGRHLFVRSGSTDGIGTNFPGQPSRLLVVNLAERRLEGAVELGRPWFPGTIYRVQP